MKTAILCILLLSSGASFGQGKVSVSVSGGLTSPTGDFGNAFNTSLGIDGVFEYALNPSVSIIGTTGYLYWSESFGLFGATWKESISSIPILGGARYYFAPGNISPYANAEAGLHILSFSGDGSFLDFSYSDSDSDTRFGFGIGGGVLFAILPSLHLDANLKYNSIRTEGSSLDFFRLFFGVRIPL